MQHKQVFVATVIRNNWEPSWILKLLFQSMIFSPILGISHPQKHIFCGKYGKSVTNRSWFTEFFVGLLLFSAAALWKLPWEAKNPQIVSDNITKCYE